MLARTRSRGKSQGMVMIDRVRGIDGMRTIGRWFLHHCGGGMVFLVAKIVDLMLDMRDGWWIGIR